MLCDKEMSTEILTIEKNLSALYYAAAEESRTEPIQSNLKDMMNSALKNQHDIIKLLLEKGLYQIEEVDSQKISKVKNKYNTAAK